MLSPAAKAAPRNTLSLFQSGCSLLELRCRVALSQTTTQPPGSTFLLRQTSLQPTISVNNPDVRVLLVEDDSALATGIRSALAANAMSVDFAEDGERALALLELNEYSVVVLDRNLPGINGDDVCRYILRTWPGTKTLMMSGQIEICDRIEGLSLGADDYITKPFDTEELIARVRALDRRSGDTTTPILIGAGVRLDPAARSVQRFGAPITLTAKEFEILTVLMKADNAIVSPDQLIERAWDEQERPSQQSLRVLVNRLRSKLGEPQPIVTMVGAGYRFDPALMPMDWIETSDTDQSSALLIKARQQFVANVGHELRAPLAVQSSLIDMVAQRFGGNSELMELVEQMRHSVMHQRRVLYGLIVLERTLFASTQFAAVNLTDMLDRIMASLYYTIGARGVNVRTQIDPQVMVEGDEPTLGVLAVNVVRNAIYHNLPSDGWLEVSLTTNDQFALLRVSNSGNVVDPAVFNRAQQRAQAIEDLALEDVSASGAGLPMAYIVAREHHADLTFTPRPEGGMDVELKLKCAMQ